MQPWKTKVVCAGRYRPRQFEYHPKFEDVVVFGTLRGEGYYCCTAGRSWSTQTERERAIEQIRSEYRAGGIVVSRALPSSCSCSNSDYMHRRVVVLPSYGFQFHGNRKQQHVELLAASLFHLGFIVTPPLLVPASFGKRLPRNMHVYFRCPCR